MLHLVKPSDVVNKIGKLKNNNITLSKLEEDIMISYNKVMELQNYITDGGYYDNIKNIQYIDIMYSINKERAKLYKLISEYTKQNERTDRKTWDDYFMDISETVATRSTCDRLSVGCVITKDRRIISTGYNGSVSGGEHCDDVGHMMVNGRCIRTIHAEQNALLYAKEVLRGATAYVTHQPCETCLKLLIQAGIMRIVYKESYKNESVDKLMNEYFGICKIEQLKG